MIRCTVPEKNEALVWILPSKIFNKNGCPIAIRTLGGNYDGFARKRFDRTVIGLSLTKIGHRDFNPLCAWPPDIATCIIPDQVTLIDIQHHNRTRPDLAGVRTQEID